MVYFIPEKNTEIANLFVYTDVMKKDFIKDFGTYLYPSDKAKIAVLMYKYPGDRHVGYRRSYVIATPTRNNSSFDLPYIEGSYDIIYSAAGRRVDLLKAMLTNMRKLWGNEIFSYEREYWYRMCALLNHFNGLKSSCTKSNIISMHYKMKKEGFYL